jgi:hypothetical protein
MSKSSFVFFIRFTFLSIMKLTLTIAISAVISASLVTSLPATDAFEKESQTLEKHLLECPIFPAHFNCFVSPCLDNPCGKKYKCCEDYRNGCNYICIKHK